MSTPSFVWRPDYPMEMRDRLVVGDALAVLQRLPDASVPLFLFSPPYNLGTSTGGGLHYYRGHYADGAPMTRRGGKDNGKSRWRGGDLANGYGDFDDALPHEVYVEQQEAVLSECWRLLTPTGAIFYNHKPRLQAGRMVFPVDYVPTPLRAYIRQEIIWARAGGVNATPAAYMPMHERIVIIARPGWRLRDQSASAVGDVWSIAQESGSWHPAPMPLKLALRVLETTAAPMVFDPFAGRGTTAKAAKLVGIHWGGCDRSAAYVERANREIDELQPLPLTGHRQDGLFAEAV